MKDQELLRQNALVCYESLSHASGFAFFPAACGELSAIFGPGQTVAQPFSCGTAIALTPYSYYGLRVRRALTVRKVNPQSRVIESFYAYT